jgi:hypothetical protein
MRQFRPTPAGVIACLALAIALGGSAFAATTLVPRNSVGSAQVINGSLLKKDFKRGQLQRGPQGPQGEQGPQGPEGAVGKLAPTARVALTAAMVDPANPSGLAAFIRTDSPSPMCLVTLAESAGAAVAGTTVYCGQRNYLGANGIYIHVFLPIPVPVGMRMDLTVYQESAQRYELPVPYPF